MFSYSSWIAIAFIVVGIVFAIFLGIVAWRIIRGVEDENL